MRNPMRRKIIWSLLFGLWIHLPELRLVLAQRWFLVLVTFTPSIFIVCTLQFSLFDSSHKIECNLYWIDDYVTLNKDSKHFGKMWKKHSKFCTKQKHFELQTTIDFELCILYISIILGWFEIDGCTTIGGFGFVCILVLNKDQIKWTEEINCTTINYA